MASLFLLYKHVGWVSSALCPPENFDHQYHEVEEDQSHGRPNYCSYVLPRTNPCFLVVPILKITQSKLNKFAAGYVAFKQSLWHCKSLNGPEHEFSWAGRRSGQLLQENKMFSKHFLNIKSSTLHLQILLYRVEILFLEFLKNNISFNKLSDNSFKNTAVFLGLASIFNTVTYLNFIILIRGDSPCT